MSRALLSKNYSRNPHKLIVPNSKNDSDDLDWAERGDYWSQQLNAEAPAHIKKLRYLHEPLILGGHGLSLRIDRGTLLIRDGFTHYPQELKEWRFFPKDRRLPSRIIILDGNGSITFDAIKWLSEQNVPLLQIDWRGEIINVAGNYGYAADPELVQAQREVQNSPRRLKFANWLILEKIKNSIETIEQAFSPSFSTLSAIDRLRLLLRELKNNPPQSTSALLSIEARAAAAYFTCWHSYPLKWKGVWRKPIPESWHKIGARATSRQRNQFARHPVNAILNYAYGILANRVKANILIMGFDPTIGCIHSRKLDKPRFVFDLMEPLRPIIDRALLQFIKQHVFSPSDFILNKNGVCALHPQFAKNIVKLAESVTEIETIIKTALNRLLAYNRPAESRALKNATSFKMRLVGKRE